MLKDWQNFFVIVGSSAGALTGLQFVVIALITQARSGGSRPDISAFGTPTVIHFCTALLISAVMIAPWQMGVGLGATIAALGLAGMAYSIRVIWHARKASHKADKGDRFWYIAVPLMSHAVLAGAGVLICCRALWSLAVVAVISLAFLFLGVRNSWDTVTFISIQQGRKATASETTSKET